MNKSSIQLLMLLFYQGGSEVQFSPNFDRASCARPADSRSREGFKFVVRKGAQDRHRDRGSSYSVWQCLSHCCTHMMWDRDVNAVIKILDLFTAE